MIIIKESFTIVFSLMCAKQIFPHQNSYILSKINDVSWILTCMTCLLVNLGNDCLIIKTIRSPCPSSDQRRKVTKVLRQAGAPHTRRTMSLYVLYSRFLQILCCITAIQQHQTKIFRRPILRRMPIQTPTQCGSLKFFINTLVIVKLTIMIISNFT